MPIRPWTTTLATVLALSLAMPAQAQTDQSPETSAAAVESSEVAHPFLERGAGLPAVIRWLIADDVKLVSLGQEGGVSGYLGEGANGRFNAFYPTPDGEHVVTGLMFRSGGANVTGAQVARMLDRFTNAAKDIEGIDPSSLIDVTEADMDISGPDMPIIDWFVEQGMRATRLESTDGGLEAYVVETAGSESGPGLMQFFYVMPDDRFAVAGVLTRRGGVTVTGLQIGEFQRRFAERQAAAESTGNPVAPGANPPAVTGPSAETIAEALGPVSDPAPSGSQIVTEEPEADTQSPDDAADETAIARPETSAPVPPAPVFNDGPVSTAPPEAAEPFRSFDIETDDLVSAVENTAHFSVGLPDSPTLYMVADPQCPYCHEAWRQLRPLVFDGRLKLEIIMIAGLSGSDPIARAILSKENPAAAWLAGQGSMPNVRVDAPPAQGSQEWNLAGDYLRMNANFINRFDVTQTPFLAYVGTDGSLFTSRGVPQSFDSFLAAME